MCRSQGLGQLQVPRCAPTPQCPEVAKITFQPFLFRSVFLTLILHSPAAPRFAIPSSWDRSLPFLFFAFCLERSKIRRSQRRRRFWWTGFLGSGSGVHLEVPVAGQEDADCTFWAHSGSKSGLGDVSCNLCALRGRFTRKMLFLAFLRL